MSSVESATWWKSLSLDDRVALCEKYYSDWKWYRVFHSKVMIERMWKKEVQDDKN
jgi:hypothetical protein